MRVAYITYAENPVTRGLIRSQVVELLKRIKQLHSNLEIVYVFFVQRHFIRHQAGETERLRAELDTHGVQIIPLPIWGKFFEINWWLSYLLLFKTLLRANVDIIHARSYRAALLGLLVKPMSGARLIFDARGLWPEEFLLMHRARHPRPSAIKKLVRNADYRFWKVAEKLLLKYSDRTVVVSDAFADYFQAVQKDARLACIPIAVDTDKFRYDEVAFVRMRRKLGLEGKFVVLYSGTIGPIQGGDYLVRLFCDIRKLKSNAHFLVLTHSSVEELKERFALEGVGSGEYTLLNVPYEELPNYVMIADVGLLLRTDTIVNHIAAPTKLSEYTACGIPILCSSIIKPVVKFIRDYGIGFAIRNEEIGTQDGLKSLQMFLDQLEGSQEEIRQRCRRFALETRSLSHIAERYIGLYEDILGEA